MRLAVCIPIYDDWESVAALIPRIDAALRAAARPVTVLLVDDGSTAPPPDRLNARLDTVSALEVVRLRRNLGHQRAIAIGLTHLQAESDCDAVVVMDGDGEDPPERIPELLSRFEQNGGERVVFAQRARRTEGPLFKAFYVAYKVLHRLLTGRRVEVGNFSVLSRAHLDRLVAVSEMWNHFAASVYKARLPTDMIPIPRERRLAGRSRMGFTSLVAHGLSAISVYGDVVGLRLLFAAIALVVVSLGAFGALAGIRVAGGDASFGTLSGVLLASLLTVVFHGLLLSILFVLLTLQGRNSASFLPVRDYRYFIAGTRRIGTGGARDRLDS